MCILWVKIPRSQVFLLLFWSCLPVFELIFLSTSTKCTVKKYIRMTKIRWLQVPVWWKLEFLNSKALCAYHRLSAANCEWPGISPLVENAFWSALGSETCRKVMNAFQLIVQAFNWKIMKGGINDGFLFVYHVATTAEIVSPRVQVSLNCRPMTR